MFQLLKEVTARHLHTAVLLVSIRLVHEVFICPGCIIGILFVAVALTFTS